MEVFIIIIIDLFENRFNFTAFQDEMFFLYTHI